MDLGPTMDVHYVLILYVCPTYTLLVITEMENGVTVCCAFIFNIHRLIEANVKNN